MRFEQMKVRPRSTRTITDFRGLWHNLEDQGTTDNSRTIRWYDERNLSSDAYPALTARKKAATVADIDGNVITHEIIAAETSGDHPVLLDSAGMLHSNGHSINTLGANGLIYRWHMTWDQTQALVSINPKAGETYDPTKLGGIMSETDATWPFYLEYSSDDDYPANVSWLHQDGLAWTVLLHTYEQKQIGGMTFDVWHLTDYGIDIYADNVLDSGWTVTIHLGSRSAYGSGTYMVRMGANVIIMPEGIMVNAEKLAAGETVDVQALNADWQLPLNPAKYLTFSPCLMDGTVVTPVKGTTAPNDTTKIWADTTGEQTVMRQWVSALESWQAMQQTYIRIDIGDLAAGTARVNDDIRQWDTVKIVGDYYRDDVRDSSWQDTAGNTGAEMAYLLGSTQLIVNRTNDQAASPPINYIVIEGILDELVYVRRLSFDVGITRKKPQMDFVVECGNRLWGCYYGPNEDATDILNEIYASKLGDPTNWQSYQGLSTDSWTASRGTSAPFTGAAVLDNSPLFFREEWLEKVYPSSTGAHQIQTYSVDGVEKGSNRSLLVIDDKLYYKSRLGVMVYEGTLPRSISAAFGNMVFHDGNAGRHQKRYEISMLDSSNAKITGVYDIGSGDWHLETGGWEGCAFCWKDELYYSEPSGADYVVKKRYGGTVREEWRAETGIISYELPEHKFVSCIRIRIRTGYLSTFKVYVEYDSSGTWAEKANYTQVVGGSTTNTKEINVYPLRCDHFRLKLTGSNGTEVISLSYRLERSEGGH